MATKWNSWSTAGTGLNTKGGILANQGDMLLALARAGAGIVRLAEFHISDDLKAGRLVALFPEHQDRAEEPIYVLYQDKRKSPLTSCGGPCSATIKVGILRSHIRRHRHPER
jgi:DNA-binding transcriptional LysR family regulator